MPSLYPLQVEVSPQDIERLTRVYIAAQKHIEKEIKTATNFGVANRKALLGQIDAILNNLAEKTDKTINEVIPKYYKMGADTANAQLKNFGAPIELSESFNAIHQEAIAALVDDTATAFGESLTGVSRSVNNLLGKATRNLITEKMAEGAIGGKSLRDVKLMIKGLLQEQGIAALKDKGGRTWTLDRYSEMLFRTKTVEARNRGLANRMVEYDYDLVQISSHNSDHEECRIWEGRILSLRGNTKGYPTISQAESEGLFHPNCKHAMNTLIPSLARMTAAYYPDEKTKYISEAEIEASISSRRK